MTTSKRDDEMPLRDPRFDAAWRAASREEPPAALDAAIRAAARREVGAGPQTVAPHDARPIHRHWWPLAAAATIGVITAGVLQLMPHDELVAPAIESGVATDMPASSATSVPPAATPTAPVEARKDTATGDTAGMRPVPPMPDSARPAAPAQLARKTAPPATQNAQQERGAVPPIVAAFPDPFPAAEPKREASPSVGSSMPETAATAGARPAPAPPPAGRAATPAPPMETSAAELAATAEPARARSDAAAVAKLASEPVPAAPFASGGAARSATDSELARPAPQARIAAAAPRAEAAADVRAKDRAALPVAEWIALIRRLRAEGKTVEGARELAAFRLAHADHERLLPADLREWRPAEK